MLAQPAQRTKGTLENLTLAKNMIEKAISNQMSSINARILRAQIYSELCYRFSGDESWMFKSSEVITRRSLFNQYKQKANEYYEELMMLDGRHFDIYKKKKISYSYPIK